MEDVDVNKILISDGVSLWEHWKKGKKNNFKYCINYKIDGEVKPSCIRFPKMSGYLNGLKENKYMNFLIKADQVSKQYNKI